MESLAKAAALIVLFIYGSGLIAFITSWLRTSIAKVITNVLGIFSMVSGCWLWYTLRDGNGFFLGLIPISLGLFAIWNYRRRNS